jgi:NTE family protein
MRQAQAAFQTFRTMIRERGLDSTPLHNLVDRYLDEERFWASEIDYGLVTYSVSDLKGVAKFRDEIPPGKLGDYILASAAYPLFQLVEIEGKKYIDGGVYDNSPVRMLVERGYKDIICIQIGSNRVIHEYGGVNVTHIYPRVPLGHALDVRREKLDEYMKMGYYDAIRTFDAYGGMRYYIKNMPSEAELLKAFVTYFEEESEWIQWVTGEPANSLRQVFESGLAKAWKWYGLDQNASYQDLILMLVEEAAAEMAIERFRIYDFWDLLQQIDEKKLEDTIPLAVRKQGRLMSVMQRQLSRWR